jgi:hypothetical protein
VFAFALAGAQGCGHDTSAPSQDAIRVRLYYVGGRASAALRVSATRTDGVTESATVGGSDAVAFPGSLASTDTVVLRVEEPGTASARFHPALAVVTGESVRGTQAFVMIPRRWAIQASGTGCRYAGRMVDIDVAAAYSRSVADPSSFYWRAPNAATGWSYRAESFPTSAMPIPVAFDRATSTDAISAADSVAFWGAVNDLESALCRDAFRPAMPSALSATRGVRVLVDRGLDATARGGPTTGLDRGASILVSGVIVCRSASCLTTGTIPQHELLHVLGFGHTCAWPSVMRAGCAGEARASAQDAAYFQVYYAARALQLSTGAQHALGAAAEWK